jgi:uroporphyrin-III C-methyltransferase
MKSSPEVRIFLVGAGPGDPELLTLKAVRAIARADVLLVDDLVNPEVLAHAKTNARVVYVGKRAGCVSTPQAFISKLLVAEAKQGHVVVRLKGGDPSIFGRAAEEIAEIRAAGLRYEIIPGITAASACAAAQGSPLTDRAAGHGVAFITGHPASDDAPINWKALLAAKVTLAIYMGVGRSAQIVSALVAAGASPALPCAIVANASTRKESRYACTLEALPTLIATQKVPSPALLIIGEAMRNVVQSAEHAQKYLRRKHGVAP